VGRSPHPEWARQRRASNGSVAAGGPDAAMTDGAGWRTSPVWSIVLAAGTGERFGAAKQFLRLGPDTLLERAIATVAAVCDGVVAVVPAGEVPAGVGPAGLGPAGRAVSTVRGGATRSESVRAGLEAVPPAASIVVIHDAAHPLASPGLVRRVVAAVESGADAAVATVPVTETVGRIHGTALDGIIPRLGLALIQMPHAFRADVLRLAHAGRPDVSDEATLLQRLGHEVVTVAGEAANIHVTTPDELRIAAILAGVDEQAERSATERSPRLPSPVRDDSL
jgi:2-C-methyl-D-erythritol 4-phosphate cytidylyltransferase